jgi:hypothetical protein
MHKRYNLCENTNRKKLRKLQWGRKIVKAPLGYPDSGTPRVFIFGHFILVFQIAGFADISDTIPDRDNSL